MTQLDPSIILRAGAVQPLQAADVLEKRAQLQLRNIEAQRQQRQDQIAEQQLALATKKQQTLADVGKAYAAGDMTGARNTAAGAGDFDLVSKLDSMDDNSRKRAFEISQHAAPILAQIASLPPEARAGAIQQAAPELAQAGWQQPQLAELAQNAGNDQWFNSKLAAAQTIKDYNDKIDKDRTFGETVRSHQATEGLTAQGQQVTMRGQNMTAQNEAANRAVTVRGQNMTDARAATTERDKQNAVLSPDAVQATVAQLRAGDKSALQNIGRGNQGALNLAMIKNELARQLKAEGLSGADIAKANAAFVGMTAAARTTGNTSAKVDYGVNELNAAAPLALQASSAVPRGSFVPLNQLQQMIARGGGSPAQKDFAVKTQALLNAYNLVAARSGSSVGEREHNATLLQTADSPEAYRAAIAAMKQEGEVAKAASKLTMGDVTGTSKPAPKPTGKRPPLSAIFK